MRLHRLIFIVILLLAESNSAGKVRQHTDAVQGFNNRVVSLPMNSSVVLSNTTVLNCTAHVVSIKINNTTVSSNGTIDVTLNNLQESFTIKLRGQNTGTDQSPQNFNNLTLAFPQYTSAIDKDKISPYTSGSSSDLSFFEYFGTEAQGCDGNAEYVLTEAVANNGWNSLASKDMSVKVKPRQWGQFVIYYRMALARESSWSNMSFDPTAGCTTSGTRDCLGYACYKITVNVIQANLTGDLKVTMKNIDGTSTPYPGSNGKVELYTTGGTFITQSLTNSSGIGTFSNLDYGTYNLKFLHSNTGTIHGTERWGSLNGVQHNSNPTNTPFTRNLPYFTGLFRIYNSNTNQEVTRQSVPVGTPLRVVLEIKNPNSAQQSIKSRFVFDRDKAPSYDGDYLSSPINIAGNNGTGTITFNVACTTAGDWYGTVGTQYLDGSTYYTCDGTAWPATAADKWLTVTATSGDMKVTMKNIDGTSVPYPGSNGKIQLYTSGGSFLTETPTNSSGIGTFSSLDYGTYNLKFLHLNPGTIHGTERWGNLNGVQHNSNPTNTPFTRNLPYFTGVFRIYNGNTNQEVTRQSVPVGTPLRVVLEFKNPNPSQQSVKSRFVFDRDKTEPYDGDYPSSAISIAGNNGTGTITFNVACTTAGDWFGTVGTQYLEGSTYYTCDGTSWPATTADKWLTVTATSGDLTVTMKNHDGTTSPYPGSNGKISIYSSTGTLVAEKSTNSNASATFTGLSFGNYTVKFNHAPPSGSTIFGPEYWGSLALSFTQTQTLPFVRKKPIAIDRKIFNTATGAEIPIGSEILTGTNLRFDIKIKNNNSTAETVKVRLVLDINKDNSYESDQTSNPVVIQANSEVTVPFVFRPVAAGDWFGVIGTSVNENNNYIISDGWAWGQTTNEKWFRIAGNTFTTLYGAVDQQWSIALFGSQYKVFSFKKAGATNEQVIYLPFKTSNATPLIENFVVNTEEAVAVLQKFQLSYQTNPIYVNYPALRSVLVQYRDYYKLGNWWQDDGTTNKRKVDRVTIGKAAFSTAKEVGKAMMGGGLSPFSVISAFLLPLANSGELDGIRPKEIQAIIAAQAIYDGQISNYENKPNLLSSFQLFQKLNKLSKGMEDLEEIQEYSEIGAGIAEASKLGNVIAMQDYINQFGAKITEVGNGFAYDVAADLLINLSGLNDFSKEIDVYSFLSDAHYDAIYGVTSDCINKLDSIIILETRPYSDSLATTLTKMYYELVNRYSHHIKSLENELICLQYRRLNYIKSRFLYPITQFVGASQSNIDQLKFNYETFNYPSWVEHSQASRKFLVSAFAFKSAYEGALEALKGVISNDNLHLITPNENSILKIGQSNNLTYKLKNNYPSVIQIQSITVSDISRTIQITPGFQTTSLAAGEIKNLNLTASVPRNYIYQFLSDPDLSSRTELNFKIRWTMGQINYQKNFRTKHVIGSFAKIDSSKAPKGIYRPGESVQIQTKCSSTQGFSNIINPQWLYKPDGTHYSIQSVGVSSSGISNATYNVPNGPFGAYGYYGYLTDQDMLTPPMFQNRVFYVVPSIEGNIGAFNWNNLMIFYAPADSFAARNIKEILQIPNERYINVNNYSLTQLRTMAQQYNSILIGGHLVNPLVNDLGQFNLTKAGDAVTKHFTAAFGTKDAVVVAGWNVRDTDIASMGLMEYYRSNVSTPSGYTISGTIKYVNSQTTPLNGVTVTLKQNGTPVQTVQSNSNGEYSFSNVAAGSYTITCATTKPWDHGTASDALLVQRYAIDPSLITDALKIRAADVNLSGGVTAADALLIRRRAAFLINSFPSGDWCFEELTITVTSQNVTQNIRGICFGDVNGSYTPPVEIFTRPLNNNNRNGE